LYLFKFPVFVFLFLPHLFDAEMFGHLYDLIRFIINLFDAVNFVSTDHWKG